MLHKYVAAPGAQGGGYTCNSPAFLCQHTLQTRTHKSMASCTHMAAHSLPSAQTPPFVLAAIRSLQTGRQDVFCLFFFFPLLLPLNKNNLLSDVGCLIVVTGPKLKCGLIKGSVRACVCVQASAFAHACTYR